MNKIVKNLLVFTGTAVVTAIITKVALNKMIQNHPEEFEKALNKNEEIATEGGAN